MNPDLLQEVRLLTNLETTKNKLLHVILLGQPELNKILKEPRFRPLKQRITVRYHLRPLNFQETKEYIIYRLKRAGSRNISLFDNNAIKEIYRYSKGLPRLINIVCDNALLAGFALERTRIGKPIIRDVINSLEGRERGMRKKLALTFVFLLIIFIFVFYFHKSILKLWR
jgi:general secretion pathway protein A